MKVRLVDIHGISLHNNNYYCVASDLGMFLEPLCLSQKQLIFLAVNNSESVHHAGGSHW